jgi:hypothetical protein
MRFMQLPPDVFDMQQQFLLVQRGLCSDMPDFPCNYLRKSQQTMRNELRMHTGVFCSEHNKIMR